MSKPAGMSIIVKRITRITVSLIFLYGVYIILHGHLSPGGGFAGGVIVALSFIHMVLAFGKDFALGRIKEEFLSFWESLGGLFFWGLAVLGFLIGGIFFLNALPKGKAFDLFSSGSILLSNIAIFFKVSAGLFIIFLGLAGFRIMQQPEVSQKERQ